MILLVNVMLIISISLCMVSAEMIWLVVIGRFFWGICAGSFSVYCPRFISELCPAELKNDFGGISQVQLTTGILVPTVMAIHIPENPYDPS